MVLRDCFAWSPMGCGPCKPQYKRLVDGIYPHNPYEGGLVKTNMEKLLFFALSSPEKIDKIGKYLAKRLEADIYRGRIGWVRTSMQALDQLLVSCQAPDQSRNLNLFVESFLTMLQRLLERDEPDLQIMACHSFIKFANIEEDTPSYKRSYDFFISRFSSVCYYRSKDLELQKNMRMAGMHGLQGVVRKTVSDDLQVNIWEEQHMNKIIPALIYNMKERYDLDVRLRGQQNYSNNNSVGPEESREVEFTTEIAQFAQDCLRDICSRCGYTNVLAVIKPTLEHHDLHKLWVPGDFAKMCISTICYAFPRQYAYKAVQILVAHLDQHAEDDAAVRISIIHVLEETVEIASTVGPSVFEVFDALLRHLKRSASRIQSSATERHFQSALVNAIGEFAANLPDYQKIEVMQLILDKARDPTVWSKRPGDNRKANASGISLNENYDMQCMLLRSLLKVSDKYVAQQMSTSFPSSLLDLLLPISVSESTQVRLLVQDIFQSLVDRHFNKKNVGKARTFDNPLDQLAQPPVAAGSAETPASNAVGSATEGVLIPETQVTSDDVRFSRMHLPRILSRMCQYITLSSNNNACYQALFATLTLIVLELAGSNNDAITEILRYCYALELNFSHPNEMPPTTANAELGELTDENVVDGVISTPKFTASTQLKSGLFSATYAQQPQPPAEISNATTVQKCAALSLVASVLSLLVQVTAPRLDKLRGHVLGILEQRRLEGFWYLLPDRLFSNDQALQTADTIGAEFERLCQTRSLPILFPEGALQLLADVNVDVERVRKPFVVEKVIESPVTSGGMNVADRAGVDVSLVNVSLELGSDTDSVSIAETTNQRKRMGPHFDSIKFENLRKVLDEPIENLRAEKHRRQREIWRNFKEAPVEELIRMVEMRRGRYAHALEDFFRTPSQSSRQSTASDSRSRSSSSAGSSSSEVTVAGTPPESVRKHRVRGAPPPLRHFEPPDILMY